MGSLLLHLIMTDNTTNSHRPEMFRLDDQGKEQLLASFKKFDLDGNGVLDVEEFKNVIKEFNSQNPEVSVPDPTNEEIMSMMNSLNLRKSLAAPKNSNDRHITFDAFLRMCHCVNSKDQESWNSFCFFDTDGDGHITTKELKSGLKRAGQPHSKKVVKAMMKEADLDGDGLVSFEE